MSPEESNAQEENQRSVEKNEQGGSSGKQSESGGSGHRARSTEEIPDVTLDVPKLGLEEAHLQVDNLRAKISLQAELSDMVRINVGLDAFLEKVELDLKGLEAQAQLKANLENVRDILSRTLESLDNNPQLVESLTNQGTGGELEGAAGTVRDAYEKPQDENSEDQEVQEVWEDDEAQESNEESAGEIEATDAARSKAEDLGVELSQVEGTGSGGRIIARDVQKAAKQR
ncbi:MAG: E3 binding domain-containing protein [Rubrobacteraceae bacterium]